MTTQTTTSQRPFEAVNGAWTNLSHTYFGQLDAAFKAAEPTLQSCTRLQMEWAQLALARTRAWATLPSEISRCRSPADLTLLQLKFWQGAGRTYTEAWQRMLNTSLTLAPAARALVAEAPRRDVLTVPEGAEDGRKRQAA